MAGFTHSLKRIVALACGTIAGLGVTFASPAAKADLIFNLNDVTFQGGGTATGTFSINQYGFLSSWNIVTTDGSIPGGVYTTAINAFIFPNDNPPDEFTIFVRDLPNPYQGFLQLTFIESLLGPLAVPGHDPLDLTASFECSTYGSGPLGNVCPAGDSRAIITGGAVDPVPEPASLALLGGGLAGLVLAKRRRR